MDITFIVPKIYQARYLETPVHVPPLGIPYLSAVLKRKGHSVKLINGEWLNGREFVKRIRSIDTRVIGISAMAFNMTEFFDLANYLRELYPEKIIIGGGRGPSSLPQEYVLRRCRVDLIFRGEAEGSLAMFMEMLDGGSVDLRRVPGISFRAPGGRIISTPFSDSAVQDLDSLPFPDRDLVGEASYLRYQEKYLGTPLGPPMIRIIASRGCPFSCAFCNKGFKEQGIRMRSADSIISEMEHCIARYRCSDFYINDDLFTASHGRLEEFCRKIIERKIRITWKAHARVNSIPDRLYQLMKASGCIGLFFGVESGSRRMLRLMGKRITPEDIRAGIRSCHAHGIQAFGYFLVGFPGEKIRDHELTMQLIRELPFYSVEVYLYMPYPDSPAFDRLLSASRRFSWDAYTSWREDVYSESKSEFLGCDFEVSPVLMRKKILDLAQAKKMPRVIV